MRTIQVGANTRPAHESFISWLNGLLNQYVTSFYDEAIQNILTVSFIREHHSFIQELYLKGGKEYVGFMSILPTDTTNYILMIHGVDGVPYLYNKTNGADLFNFDSEGKLTNFFENVTIPLYDQYGNTSAECFITFKELYGIKVPMYVIKMSGSNYLVGEGYVDFNYDTKYSGTYMVETAPLDSTTYYEVINETVSTIVLDVPILEDFNLQYEFRPKQVAKLPYTEYTEYFLRQMKELGTLKYKLITA